LAGITETPDGLVGLSPTGSRCLFDAVVRIDKPEGFEEVAPVVEVLVGKNVVVGEEVLDLPPGPLTLTFVSRQPDGKLHMGYRSCEPGKGGLPD
jgi:hypothetical protein